LNKVVIIARKEFTEITRSRILIYLLILLAILTISSLTVSFLVFNNQVTEYQHSLDLLTQLGKEPVNLSPILYPLNLLRGVVDYVEIVGAIVGLLLGYISIAKERNTKALKLLLSRPVTKKEVAYGKILGNALFILILMSIIGITAVFIISFIGGIVLSPVELLKVVLFIIFSTMYIVLFFMVSFFLSLQQRTISHALILSFTIWLAVVLIIPQIGDTMDPDNQVPGGLFKSMNIDKPLEKLIIAKFSDYENTRGFIEQISVTKNYERIMFAIFGIKQTYNGVPLLTALADNLGNIVLLIIYVILGFTADYLLLMRNKNYLRG